jgi:ubiquinone/menaquinone biosynthesis C-methylase UbiE
MSASNKIAKRYNRIAGIYDIMEAPMENLFSKWRREMLKEASGKTLEVGIGTGKNIPFYPEDIQLTGIDFSPKMVEIAREKAEKSKSVKILEMDAENMSFSDDSFDTVVTSCVFCSVPNPVKGLEEIRRVCKNKGKILMLEHVRSRKKVVGELMDVFNFIPLHLYGANINRETYENLLKAGFSSQHIKVRNLWHDIVKYIEINNLK